MQGPRLRLAQWLDTLKPPGLPLTGRRHVWGLILATLPACQSKVDQCLDPQKKDSEVVDVCHEAMDEAPEAKKSAVQLRIDRTAGCLLATVGAYMPTEALALTKELLGSGDRVEPHPTRWVVVGLTNPTVEQRAGIPSLNIRPSGSVTSVEEVAGATLEITVLTDPADAERVAPGIPVRMCGAVAEVAKGDGKLYLTLGGSPL